MTTHLEITQAHGRNRLEERFGLKQIRKLYEAIKAGRGQVLHRNMSKWGKVVSYRLRYQGNDMVVVYCKSKEMIVTVYPYDELAYEIIRIKQVVPGHKRLTYGEVEYFLDCIWNERSRFLYALSNTRTVHWCNIGQREYVVVYSKKRRDVTYVRKIDPN